MRLSSRTVVVAVGVAIGSAALLAVTVGATAQSVETRLLIGLGVVLVVLSGKRFSQVLLSPVRLIAAGFLVVATLGSLFSADLSQGGIGGASANIVLSSSQTSRTAQLLAVAAILIIVGGFAAGVALPVTPKADFSRLEASAGLRKWLLVVTIIPALMVIVDTGFGNLLRRSQYIPQRQGTPFLHGIGAQLAVAAVVVLGFLFASERGGRRLFAGVLILFYLVLFFSLGSRRLALLPVLVVFGVILAKQYRRASWPILTAAVAVSVYALKLPLYLRGLPQHGLLPYLAALPDFASNTLQWTDIFRNILISFPLIGYTAYGVGPIPKHDFFVAVNPLPGGTAGWTLIQDTHRVNTYTPFAGVGEVANAGPAYVLVFFLMLGFVLALLDMRVSRLLKQGRQIIALAIVGLAVLFLLYALQYNLRAGVRLVYYALALSIVSMWIPSRFLEKGVSPGDAGAAEVTEASRSPRKAPLPAR